MNFHNPFNSGTKTDDDLGFGNKIDATQGRLMRRDGSFNVERTGFKAWTPYQDLVEMSWTNFLTLILLIYILINAVFAGLFVFIGIRLVTL